MSPRYFQAWETVLWVHKGQGRVKRSKRLANTSRMEHGEAVENFWGKNMVRSKFQTLH